MVWSYPYMYYKGRNYYMMKVVDMNEVVFTYLLMYELDGKTCGLMIGLLTIWGVMGLHMYIELVDLDLDYEYLRSHEK